MNHARIASAFSWALHRIQRTLPEFDAIPWIDDSARGPFNRHYAFVRRGENVVHVAGALNLLPLDRRRAILLHEMGHILVDGSWVAVDEDLDDEQRADMAVEVATGVAIRYDANLMQTLGKGILRPAGLR